MKTEAALGIKLLNRSDQAEITFLDEVQQALDVNFPAIQEKFNMVHAGMSGVAESVRALTALTEDLMAEEDKALALDRFDPLLHVAALPVGVPPIN